MQPLRLAVDPEAGFVEAAHRRGPSQSREASEDRLERSGLSLDPVRQGVWAEADGAKQISERLGDPVPGDELLDVEIDRRRPQARAILRRRAHPRRERRSRLAATTGAGVDHGLMLGHLDQPLGKVEHLARLQAGLHRSRERSTPVTARLRLVPNDPVRIGHPAQRVALVALLPAARLAGGLAKASRKAWLLSQPVARRRLRARRAVLIQAPPKLGHLGAEGGVLDPQRFILAPQFRDLAPKRLDQLANLGRENHPNLDSHFLSARLANPSPPTLFIELWQFGLIPSLGVTKKEKSNSQGGGGQAGRALMREGASRVRV